FPAAEICRLFSNRGLKITNRNFIFFRIFFPARCGLEAGRTHCRYLSAGRNYPETSSVSRAQMLLFRAVFSDGC
ncbi:hypothetical protein, partial [Alistipes finegoldii]|uniref:hypothetical protein n=1 Tax=Alistipes finegoldii TaxID=214856 RepID=UPI003AB3131C